VLRAKARHSEEGKRRFGKRQSSPSDHRAEGRTFINEKMYLKKEKNYDYNFFLIIIKK